MASELRFLLCFDCEFYVYYASAIMLQPDDLKGMKNN